MLEGLFDEEVSEFEAKESSGSGGSKRLPRPSPPRNNTGLCGLSNLGATCYLNSLLQTLHFTPEFREELFRLPEDELGVFSSMEGADNSMVRVIPIQLQKLFANLLLLNQQSSSVDALTNSFGWKSSEEFQQHDVQELNRILFSAIESSLLGTSGEQLIAKLYHGISVQQITCQSCARVSEREEEYLDLPVALSGRPNLETVLKDTYIEQELLEGANQYYCETCRKLVDAKRGCHIRKLPPILTFALLRFLYDFERGERYKDTSKFKFPLELDMSPYCESESVKGGTIYELFSVVIHSGSTHSGHYTAYIKDVDCLGSWTHPEEEPVQLPSDPTSGSVDLIDFENPADLIQELVRQLGGVVTVAKLCKALQEKTGVTWNKRFKKQFGPIGKFLKSCSDRFTLNDLNQVSLCNSTKPSGHETTSHTPTAAIHCPTQPDTMSEVTEKPSKEDSGELIVSVNVEQTASSSIKSLSSGLSNAKQTGHVGNTVPTENMETESLESSNALEQASGLPTVVKQDKLHVSADKEMSDGSVSTRKGGAVPFGVDSNVASTVASVRGDNVDDGGGGMFPSAQGEGRENGDGRKNATKTSAKKDPRAPPPPGHCWFEFNDTYVSPIIAKNIDKMFQGKQSAYMLFYRRKSMQRPIEAQSNLLYAMPERFQVEVATTNNQLDDERYHYDLAINTVQVNVNFSLEFVFSNGALQQISDSEPCMLSIDRRNTIADLKTDIVEAFPDMCCPGDIVIHTARSLPAGMHLYNCITDNERTSVADAGITDQCHLFVWDGKTAGGETIQVGGSCEPIVLHVTYPKISEDDNGECELVSGFPKNSTLGQLRESLSNLLDIQSSQVTISQVKISEKNGQSSIVVLSSSKDSSTLEELKLSDGDRLTIERNVKKGVKSLAHSVADKHNKMLSLIIENRLLPLSDPSTVYPVFPVEVGKDELVSTLKATALRCINPQAVIGNCRFRVDDDMSGLGPPLYETQALSEAGVSPGQRLILECGLAPLNNQVALQCVVSSGLQSVAGEVCEVILGKSVTVRECRDVMVVTAGLTGGEWHLRKTNWCGEAADTLEDEDSTLEQEKIKSGDLLLIEEGRLPPKGFIHLKVYLYYPSSESSGSLSDTRLSHDVTLGTSVDVASSNGTGTQSIQNEEEVPLLLIPPSQYYPPVPGELVEVGGLEISKEATVEDLKLMILTLPALENARAPLPGFLRVRELVNGRPGKIFKLHSHSMRRLKLSSGSKVCCTVLPQEEDLPMTSLVFNIRLRIPGEREYGPYTEVMFDTAQSTSPYALRSHVSQLLDIPLERLQMAKHKMENFEWLRIQDSYQTDSGRRGRKKSHGSKVNIRNSPIMLKDGDTIAIKDLQYDPDDVDDFSTPLDDKGKAVLAAIQEDKRKRRKAKGTTDLLSETNGSKGARQRRHEVGIKIFVPDYRTNSKQIQ